MRRYEAGRRRSPTHWPAGGGGACWQRGSSGSCGALPSVAACSGRSATGNWCCAAAPFGSGEFPEPTAIQDVPAIDTAACNLASIAPVHVMKAVSSCWCGLSHFAWFLGIRPLVRRDALKGFNVEGCMCRKEWGEERHCQREMLQAAAAKLQRGRLRRMLGSWAAASAMAAARRQQHRLADAAAARRSSALLPQVGLEAVFAVSPFAVPLRLMDSSPRPSFCARHPADACGARHPAATF